MRSNKTPSTLRAFGQRSLPSLFHSCSKKPVGVFGEETRKCSPVSPSDSSQLKLQRNSAKCAKIKESARPFSSVFGPSVLSKSTDGQIEAKKGGEAEKNPLVELLAFEKFKHTDLGDGDSIGSSTAGGLESRKEEVVNESRKRRNPFAGGSDKHIVRKHFTVLGGDPKPRPSQKRRREDESSISKETPGPAYNHYSNGFGWWDCDREGVDNEEVGVNEVWEGVGSTTLGGIEWH